MTQAVQERHKQRLYALKSLSEQAVNYITKVYLKQNTSIIKTNINENAARRIDFKVNESTTYSIQIYFTEDDLNMLNVVLTASRYTPKRIIKDLILSYNGYTFTKNNTKFTVAARHIAYLVDFIEGHVA